MEHKRLLYPLWTTSNFRKQIQPWYYLSLRNELKKKSPVYTKTCQHLRQKRTNENHASEGAAFVISNKYVSTEISLKLNLEAVAISISFTKRIYICIINVYFTNNFPLDLQDLEELIVQLPIRLILSGEFDSHHALLGSTKTDSRGKTIENLLNNQDLILPNISFPTHFSTRNGKSSVIDLTFFSPQIAQHLEWEILKYLYDGDHFPLKITSWRQYHHNSKLPAKMENKKKKLAGLSRKHNASPRN